MSDTKQVIVMRKDLNMRKGKMIAQGAHAAMMFLTLDASIDDWGEEGRRDPLITSRITPVAVEWLESSYKKICVGAASEDELLAIHQAALAAGLKSYLCTDNGLTEFSGVQTVTCCAIGPDRSELIDRITGHLPLL